MTSPAPPTFAPAEPLAEDLAQTVTALVAEVAVLRERLDTLERVLTEARAIAADAIDGWVADGGTVAEREAWRQRYLERLYGHLTTPPPAAPGVR
jgi:hypothetical protein